MEKGTSKQKKAVVFREFSSGGVVYKRNRGKTLWLVSRSSPSLDYPKTVWRLQKGWLDDDEEGKVPGKLARGEVKASEEDLQKAALREVKEEGGVSAEVFKKLTTERYFYKNKEGRKIMKFVTFYLMRWLENVPGGFGAETSEIKWLPYLEARKLLTHSGEKKVLDKANTLLNAGLQSSLI